MRIVLFAALAFLPLVAFAQDACETKCNQQASECLKACVGDAREAAKPENAQKMMACLQKCEKETAPCRQQCKKK